MGLLSSIFGGDSVIDAGINGIDAMVFTDQEQSKAKLAFLKLYEPFKLAQRYLAMTFAPAYVFGWVITFGIEVVNIFTVTDLDTGKLYAMLHGDFATMVILIISFYFGGGAVEGIIKRLAK